MECLKCNKTFRDNWNLKIHEKTKLHIQGRVGYYCSSCNFKSSDLSKLKQHILGKRHREKIVSNPLPELKTLKNRLKKARKKHNVEKMNEAKHIIAFITRCC